jgi:hypothetical protein
MSVICIDMLKIVEGIKVELDRSGRATHVRGYTTLKYSTIYSVTDTPG